MGRFAHVVKPVGFPADPNAIVIVQAACKQHFLSEGDDTGTMLLHHWTAEMCSTAGGSLKAEGKGHGESADSFWNWLRRTAQSCKTVRLMSMNAREVLAAVGLWDCVMAETVTLRGFDPYSNGVHDSDTKYPREGYAILEGPPTVVVFRMSGLDAICTWTGTENYGAGAVQLATVPKSIDGNYSPLWGGDPWLEPETLHTQVACVRQWTATYLDTIREMNLGPMENTAATQAMLGYRRGWMDFPITVHDNQKVIDLERAAMYAGRNECRFIGTVYAGKVPVPVCIEPDEGKPEAEQAELYGETAIPWKSDVPRPVASAHGPIYHLDVNSLYTAVAASAHLPCKLQTAIVRPSVKTLLAACRAIGVIAKVEVETRVPCVPVQWDGSIIYPVGKFATTLCGPEIILASEMGKITGVDCMAAYECKPIYKRWTKELYQYRLRLAAEGKRGMADCVKVILNSSYGKWAQLRKRWEDVPEAVPLHPFDQWWGKDHDTGKPVQFRSMAWLVQKQVQAGEMGDTFPAITAYIQSLARVRLWQLMEAAGHGNIYYYDTDSLFVNPVGYDNLDRYGEIHATELGRLKRAGVHQCVTFYGLKRYIADGKLTLAGCGRATCPDGSPFAVGVSVPPLGYYLQAQRPPGFERRFVRTRLNLPYTHGRVMPNGLVEPHTLKDR